MNQSFPELYQDCIWSLHAIFKLGESVKHKFEEYKINLEAFANQASAMIESSSKENNTVLFVNIAAMISASCNCIGPEYSIKYIGNIKTLTHVISNKVDLEWKNAAILLATLSKNEECKEKMWELHALEVLASISGSLNIKK